MGIVGIIPSTRANSRFVPDANAISRVDIQTKVEPAVRYNPYTDYIPEMVVTPGVRVTPEQRTTPYIDYTTDVTIIPETKITPPDNKQPEPTPKPPEPYIPPPTIIPPLFPLPPLGGGGGGGGAAAAKPGRGSSFSARYNYGQGIGDMFGSMRPLNFSKSAPAPRKKSRRK